MSGEMVNHVAAILYGTFIVNLNNNNNKLKTIIINLITSEYKFTILKDFL